MSKTKSDFGIISRLLIIAFSLGIIMIAVYPNRKEIKSSLSESKAELKRDYPMLFGEGSSKFSSEEKILVQTPAVENKKGDQPKNNKTMDKLSKSDREELDKLVNQK